MNDSVASAARTLRLAAASLRDTGAAVAAGDPGCGCFGGDGPGRLGELGRALHGQLARALATYSDEAARHSVRMDAAADQVAVAAHRYDESDNAARRAARQPGQPGQTGQGA